MPANLTTKSEELRSGVVFPVRIFIFIFGYLFRYNRQFVYCTQFNSIRLKTRIIKPVIALFLLLVGTTTSFAQDVDVDSLNNALLSHINKQRQGVGLEDLVSTQVMEDAAQDQANYCAEQKMETSIQKELKKSTAALRVTFFGGIKDGVPQEIIVSENVKNSKGIELGTGDLLAKLIKKLDKATSKKIYSRADLYYAGVRASYDPISARVYVCVLMGDINIINNAGAHSKDLDKNYKISTHAFHWWWRRFGCRVNCLFGKCDDGTVCNSFDDLKELYSRVDIDKGFYIKDKKLYLREEYKKYFMSEERNTTKLISDKNDRLLIYIIEKSQFPCNTSYNISVGASAQSGLQIGLHPITLGQLTSKGDLAIDKLPEGFSEDFEIGIKVVKYCDEKIKCEVYDFYDKLNRLKPYFTPVAFEELPLLLDTQTAKTAEPFIEVKTLTWNIPFERNKFEYKQSDVEPIIDSLNEPKFTIQEIKITAFSSIEGDSVKNFELQQKRAASIVKVLEQQQAGTKIKYTVKQGNSWDIFRRQILLTNYYYLADSSQSYVRMRLNKDTTLSRKIEHLLQAERFASIEMRVSFDLKKLKEDEYWAYRIQKAIEKKDLKRALSNQTALIKLYQAGKVSYERFMAVQIPMEAKYIALLNNKFLYINNTAEKLGKFETLRTLDPNNPIIKYNYLALKLNSISALDNDARREELQILSSLFSSLTATAIPVKLYNTLRSRFHPIINDNRKSKKAETYKNIKELSQSSPVLEAVFLADYYADQKRFDLAAQILFDHYADVNDEDSALCREYCLRMLYFGKASKNEAFEKQYYGVFKKLQKTNPELFCEIFNKSKVSFKFFENLHVKKLYCDACSAK